MAPGPFFIKDVLDGDKAKVKPLEVFRPLGTVGVLNTSLMVPMDSPFKTAKDFVNYYKANPDKVARWANTGNASLHTLGGHAFYKLMELKLKRYLIKVVQKQDYRLLVNKLITVLLEYNY